MKKIVSIVLGLIILAVMIYLIIPDKKQNKQIRINSAQTTKHLESYLVADWLNTLPEYNWDNIKTENGSYSYKFKEDTSNAVKIAKSLNYTRSETGSYLGTMKISFSETSSSYIVDIPKSFASHVDSLNFSTPPSKIINPDPIVEFTNIAGEIEIESIEEKNKDEIKNKVEGQVFETEYKRCESLAGEEALSCALSLIVKYRDSKALAEELKDVDMSQIAGGSALAVFKSDLGTCDYVKDKEDRIRCYEYAYQILVGECHIFDDKNYRYCVRELSAKLPSFKEQRLFCGHIDDEAMSLECQGLADVEVCDEILESEKSDLCKLNIARTNNNMDTCSKINNSDYQQVCIGLIGIAKDEEAYCDKIDDEYISGQCRAKIAIQKNDNKICDRINDEDSKNICYGHFIINKQDVSQEMCNGINELFIKEMCEMVLAIKNKDTWKCTDPEIVSFDNQPLCFLGMAIKHKDADLCNKIDISLGEFPEDRKIKENMRDTCYMQIAIDIPDASLCENIIDTAKQKECKDKLSKPVVKEEPNDEEKLKDYPPMPGWFDCPIPEGSKLYTWKNSQQSGYRWTDPEYTNRYRGPYLKWWGEDFSFPNQIICYNAEGEKHGPLKEWVQGKDVLIQEGNYRNDKPDGVIKQYAGGLLFKVITYTDGIKNGPTETYCSTGNKKCTAGELAQKGFYKENYQSGFWSTYENGSFKYRQEFIKGEVTRDETGMSITYYNE